MIEMSDLKLEAAGLESWRGTFATANDQPFNVLWRIEFSRRQCAINDLGVLHQVGVKQHKITRNFQCKIVRFRRYAHP